MLTETEKRDAFREVLGRFCSRTDFNVNNQYIHTPYELCREMVEKLKSNTTLTDKIILTFNLEFVEVLCYDFAIKRENIWFVTDCKEKANIIKHLHFVGVNVICVDYLSIPEGKTLQENLIKNKVKADIIIGNPPYNSSRREEDDGSQDIYDDFIHVCAKTSKIVCFITPSKWFVMKNKKTQILREKMVNEYGLKLIEEKDPVEIFKLPIKGGVSYFVIDRDYKDNEVIINGKKMNLKNQLNKYGVVVPYFTEVHDSILSKIQNKTQSYCDSIFNRSQNIWGIETNDERFQKVKTSKNILCRVSKQKGNVLYFPVSKLKTKNHIDNWKVIIASMVGADPNGRENLSNYYSLLKPDSVCSKSYRFFGFDSKEKAENFLKYLQTNFVNFLVKIMKIKPDIVEGTYKFVPLMDLTDEEIKEIEKSHNGQNGKLLTDETYRKN